MEGTAKLFGRYSLIGAKNQGGFSLMKLLPIDYHARKTINQLADLRNKRVVITIYEDDSEVEVKKEFIQKEMEM